MKNLLFFSSLLLLGCGEKSSPAASPPKPEATQILAVEVKSAGGQLGYTSQLRLTADSTFYTRTIMMEASQNDAFRRPTDPALWQSLTGDLNVDRFRNAASGESVQPVDGIDTEISILTNRDTISRLNAHESPEWQKILLKIRMITNE